MSLAQLFLPISEYSSEAAIIYKYFLFYFTRHSYVSPRLRLLGVNWAMLWVKEFIQNWQICHWKFWHSKNCGVKRRTIKEYAIASLLIKAVILILLLITRMPVMMAPPVFGTICPSMAPNVGHSCPSQFGRLKRKCWLLLAQLVLDYILPNCYSHNFVHTF